MVERFNPTNYNQKTHGSNRRGVFPVPSVETVAYRLNQSQSDKQRVLDVVRSRRHDDVDTSVEAAVEELGLGNQDLPAFKHKNEIVDTVQACKAMILSGETGSGKSTQVPQFLIEAGFDNIFVLVPRRVIADGLGDRIREELTGKLEHDAHEVVGIIHGERVDIHENNRITVMTPDTFNGMARGLSEKNKDKKVAIIADEIHEANLYTEIATGIAAKIVQRNKDWHLIASSATHNIDVLHKPFARINDRDKVPIVTIEGRPFNIEFQEVPRLTPMELYASFDDNPEKTMIFTSGKKEIDYIIAKTRDALEKRHVGASKDVIFRKLHGELTEFEMSHINDPIAEGQRLVIVSSPAGMSGITIPGVTRVISDGTINRAELDDEGTPGLIRRYLSKAGILQQIGRAGRDVSGGIGYLAKPITIIEDYLRERQKPVKQPQMPFVPFEQRLEHEPAEIYHTNLGRIALRVSNLNWQLSDINEYIPHRVAQSSIIEANESLHRVGALDRDREYNITKIGRHMNTLPLSPELSRGVMEAYYNNRTVQHLAHIAIIAAAVDVGGIQDFSNNTMRWRQLVRPTTTDDFVAQLDLMMSVIEKKRTFNDLASETAFYNDYDIHPKRLDRALKMTKKIFRVLNLNSHHLVLSSPLPEEEELLRKDLTAGMIDLVYQETHRDREKIYYTNIHSGPNGSTTERFLSGRSVSHPSRDTYIAGFPRWYAKHDKSGVLRHYDVIDQTLFVNQNDVGDYAEKNGLLVGLPLNPRIEGDIITEQEQRIFGSIKVGAPTKKIEYPSISKQAQDLLVEHTLNEPGEEQRSLREIVQEIERYQRTIPPDVLKQYTKNDAPKFLTHETIKNMVREIAKTTRSLSEIDRKLGEYVYHKRMNINRYFDNEARAEMITRSPEVIEIAGRFVPVLYQHGQPYVTRLNAEQRKAAQQGLYLPDGREVLLQVVRDGNKYRQSIGASL